MGKKEDDYKRGYTDGLNAGIVGQLLHESCLISSKHYDMGFRQGVLDSSRSTKTEEYQEETNSVDSEYDDEDDYYGQDDDEDDDEEEDGNDSSTLKKALVVGGVVALGLAAIGVATLFDLVNQEEENNED